MPRTAATERLLARPFGPTLAFNGTTSKVVVPTSSALNFGASTSFTICWWVKPPGATVQNPRMIDKRGASGAGFSLAYSAIGSSSYLSFITLTDGSVTVNPAGTVPVYPSQWNFEALVVDRTAQTAQLFTNGTAGVSTSTSALGSLSGSTDLWFGQRADGLAPFAGNLSDVRVFNSALTQTELEVIKNSGNNPSGKTPVGWWKLNEGNGTVATDSSSNANHGTITSGAWVSDAPSGSLAVYNSFTSSATVPDVGPTFTTTVGTATVSGGVLKTTSGTNSVTAAPVGSDVTAQMKFRFNSLSVSGDIRALLHLRADSTANSNYIECTYSKTFSVFVISTRTAGSATQLGNAVSYTFANDTDYWARVSTIGNEVILSFSEDGVIFREIMRRTTTLWSGQTYAAVRIQDSGSDGLGANGATVDDLKIWTGRAPARERLQNRNFGTGLYFDGSGDYVTPALNSGFDITTGDFSISTWIRCLRSDPAKFQWFICGKRPDGVTNGYLLQVPTPLLSTASAGKIRMDIYNASTGTNIIGSTAVDDGQWHHIVGVYDRDANGHIYVDGVEDARGSISARAATITNADSFLIGRCNWNTGSDYQGQMQDFRFFNRVLTPAEVRALYATGTNPSDAATSLVGSYAFDEGSGSSATDASGNARTGTITGATYRGDAPSGGLVFLHTGATAAASPDLGTANVEAGSFTTSGGWLVHGNTGNAQLRTRVGPDVTIQAKVNFGNSTGTDRRMEIRFRDDGSGNAYCSSRYRAAAQALDMAYRVTFTANYIMGVNLTTVDSTDYWFRVSCIGGRIRNWSSTDGITWTPANEIGILPALAYNNNTYVQFILIDNGTTPTIKMTDLKIWRGRPPIA